jgi:hypothetical protein
MALLSFVQFRALTTAHTHTSEFGHFVRVTGGDFEIWRSGSHWGAIKHSVGGSPKE